MHIIQTISCSENSHGIALKELDFVPINSIENIAFQFTSVQNSGMGFAS